MRHWKLLLAFACLPLLAVECPRQNNYIPFSIRVVDRAGNPLDSVAVYSYNYYGGYNWGGGNSYAKHLTNSLGWVELDGYGENKDGSLRLNDYFPVDTTMIRDATYILSPTPYVATGIAELEGGNYRFYKNGVISLTSHGYYRYFPLTPSGVSTPASIQLQVATTTYETWFHGNELWLRNNEKTLFRYDLSDPLHPTFIDDYRFLPFSDPYDLRLVFGDGIILVSGMHRNVVAVFEIVGDSLFERSTFPTEGSPRIMLRGRRLMMFNDDGMWGYDISDLRHPILVNPNRTGEYETGIFADTLMLRTVVEDYYGDSTEYQIYDMRDPAIPIATERIKIPGRLQILMDPQHAIGTSTNSSYRFPYGDNLYFIRQSGSGTFAIVGYSTNNISAATGNLMIGANVLYRLSAR